MDIKKYRVKPNKKVDLEKFSTKKDDSYSKKEVKEEILPQNLKKMFEFQEKLYAENKRGILVVLQAMDAAGKDSLVKKCSRHLILLAARLQASSNLPQKNWITIICGELHKRLLLTVRLGFSTDHITKMYW